MRSSLECEEAERDSSPELLMGEAQQSVSLTSFMTAVGFFFIGLLLTGAPELQLRLRVALASLFVSAFAFLHSTLVYANASGELTRLQNKEFGRQMCAGNVVSEYLGVYPLAFAVPLVVLGYSPDRPLAIVVGVLSLGGWLLYHLLGYAIIERYYSRTVFQTVITMIGAIAVGSFICLQQELLAIHYALSIALGIGLAVLTTDCLRRREESER